MRVKAVMAAMKEYGYPMFIVRTYDTLERQGRLYAQGRTMPGKMVTWTKRSWHNLRKGGKPCARAIDLAFLKQKRFPDRGYWSLSWPWERLIRLGNACDLTRTVRMDLGHLVDKRNESFTDAWNKSDKN